MENNNNNQAVATVKSMFEKSKNEIQMALPRHMTADRMMRIALTEIRKTPKLLECTPQSLIGAIIQASQLGLEPGSALGHCYLIPFWNKNKGVMEVQFMPGYRGFIDLARRSGEVAKIVSRIVRVGDRFEYEYGVNEFIKHAPIADEDAEMTHVYAIAFFKDGTSAFEVMTKKQIESVRSRSKSKDSGPWVTDFEEMARKTPVRKLFKYLPVSVEIQKAVTYDEQATLDISQNNGALLEFKDEEGAVLGEAKPEAKKEPVRIIRSAKSKDESTKKVEETTEEKSEFELFNGRNYDPMQIK